MPKKTIAACVFPLVFGANTLFAEPISIAYSIQVAERCSFRDGECSAFSAAFPLTLTFDSAVTRESDTPQRHIKIYGPPSFSSVPLEQPAVPPTARIDRQTGEITTNLFTVDWAHGAAAEQRFVLETPEVRAVWNLTVENRVEGLSGPAILSPETMVEFIGRGDFGRAFEYSYIASNVNPPFSVSADSIAYFGFVTLADQSAPIPEPGTCILVGSALMGMWYRGRRTRAEQIGRRLGI